MDQLLESLWHGSPLLGDRELKYDGHSKRCGEFFGKNNEVLQGGANLWCWIEYKKANDFVLHSWINDCLELFGIANNAKNVLEKSMEQWKLSLLFVLSMVPLSLILRKVNASYECWKKEYKLNHMLFMDYLKLLFKSEEQMDALVRTVHVFSTDIGTEPGMKKWGILAMKRGKEAKKEGYTYLGIVELNKSEENEMNKKQ